MRKLPVLIAVLTVVSSCASDESSDNGTPTGGLGEDRPSASTVAQDDALDLVVLSDSLALGGWPQRWAELIEVDLDVEVNLHDHSVSGKAGYDAVLQQPDVRDALRDAEIVFISPDPDYLREACPPATSAPGCVTEFSSRYREQWAGWLDEIGELTNGAMLRSAQAWLWLAPSGSREGLIEFMDQMAAETLEHGGLVADVNRALTGSDLTGDPPTGWIDSTAHLTGPGADTMAELLHELGYEVST